jgi:hypothetical protein
VVVVAAFLADLASVDEQLEAERWVGEPPGGGLAVAIHASRPDHPSPCRAANCSRTNTSRRRAIRRCTNSNGGLSK